MWRPELRAIVVHMFLFPPSPLLLDGFICNFSPPSAGPSPVLVPAWAYPDGWVNNVHYCIQVMATICHSYTIYILQHTKKLHFQNIYIIVINAMVVDACVSILCLCPQLRPGLVWAASLHLVTSAAAAGGGQISNWIFISHYFKLARKWTHWSTAHCSICPYWFLKGCQNKVLVNNCCLQCPNSWLMSRPGPELEHVYSNNNITMTLPKQKREPRLQCRQNVLDHKPSGVIFHANIVDVYRLSASK